MNQSLSARYKVLQLFEGGSSLLQKVQDLHTNQTMVLKFPKRPEARERIAREARVFQHLSREGSIPGLVRFFGYEENQEHPLESCLSLEFLQGTTLAARLETHGVLSENETISIGRSLCKILSKLHKRKVIHRDISINNIILLEGSGDVRLIDLGLALVRREDGDYEPHDLGRVGTPATRAPELSDSFPGDERCDIYSLGEVLYQLANGPETSAQKKLGLNAEVKSQISKELSRVIKHCQKSPGHRYQSMQELDSALFLLQAKKVIIRASRACGALLLLGGIVAAVAYVLSPSTPLPTATLPNPSTAPAPVLLASTQPATTPTKQPSTSAAEENRVPTKPAKSKIASATKPTLPPTHDNSTAKNLVQEPDREEEEIDAIMRAKLLKIATEPTPIAKPQPIEIRVVTPKK